MKPETSISERNITSDSEFENYEIDIPFPKLGRAHNRLGVRRIKERILMPVSTIFTIQVYPWFLGL